MRWILAAALLLTGGGVVAMRGGDPTEAEAPRRLAASPVLAATVAPADGYSNAYTGVVAARTDSGLGFRVGGEIVE
ncbi:MAG: efflux RND transporter periplasmic adaptor subunit, partial [Myxococcota bacterium]